MAHAVSGYGEVWRKSSYSAGGDCVEVWRKSSHSNANGCVEVSGAVKVRDSQLGEGSPVLAFTPAAWRRFLGVVKADGWPVPQP